MKTIYRAYLRDFNGRVPAETKTITSTAEAADEAFTALVNRTDLDGQQLVAVLSYNNRQLAFHRFDRDQGDADYWRDKLDEIEWPHRRVGAPQKMENGKRVNVYLDEFSIDIASKIGDGNVSDGIRIALKQAAERFPD